MATVEPGQMAAIRFAVEGVCNGVPVSTAARVVNAIDWISRAPQGLIAVEDIPQSAIIRGLMWGD